MMMNMIKKIKDKFMWMVREVEAVDGENYLCIPRNSCCTSVQSSDNYFDSKCRRQERQSNPQRLELRQPTKKKLR